MRYHMIGPVTDHVVGHMTEGVKDHVIAWRLRDHMMHHMEEHVIVSQDHVLPFSSLQLDYS